MTNKRLIEAARTVNECDGDKSRPCRNFGCSKCWQKLGTEKEAKQ